MNVRLVFCCILFVVVAAHSSESEPTNEPCTEALLTVTKADRILIEWKILVGRRIREAMESHAPSLTQSDLAEMLTGARSNQPYISTIIRGKRELSRSHAHTIANLLNVDVLWLIAADFFEPYINILTEEPALLLDHPIRRTIVKTLDGTLRSSGKKIKKEDLIDQLTVAELVDALENRGWHVTLERKYNKY